VDLRMPGISGLEVIDTLASEAPDTPVVVLSGTGIIADAMDAIRRGAWDFVNKPLVDMNELEHVVRTTMERAKLRKESRLHHEHLEAEVARRTSELTELNERLKAIVNSTRIIAACADVESLGRQLLEEFAVNMAAEGGSLYFLEGENLILKHSLDPGHAARSIPLPLAPHSVFGRVLKEKMPIVIRDIQTERHAHPSGWTNYTNGSLLAFPFFDGDEAIMGIVSLHNKAYPPFTDQDMEIGSILASHSCGAIKATHAMDSLRKSEEKYRDLVENMNDAVYRVNADGKIAYVSPVMEKITGYTRSEILGRNYDMLFPAEESNHLKLNFQALLQGEATRSEYLMHKKSGEAVWVRTSSRPIRRGGRIVGLQGILTDVTDAKMAAQQLSAKARELTILNDLSREIGADLSVPSAVKTALEHALQSTSADFTILFLKEDGDLLLKGFAPRSGAFTEEEFPVHEVGKCLCGIAARAGEPVYSLDINKDPRCTFQECRQAGFRSFAALPLTSGEDILGLLGLASFNERDFQEEAIFLEALSNNTFIGLKNAILYEKAQADTEELKNRLKRIQESDREKKALTRQLQQTQKMEAIGTLAGGIAHDFNNILSGIIGYTELALMGGEKLNAYLNRVLDAGMRAQDLVQQILKFSRRDETIKGIISLSPIIKESIKLMRSTLPAFIEIQERIDADPDRITGDATQIHQVIMNLCTNAYHAMRDGGALKISLEKRRIHNPKIFMSLKVTPGEYLKLSIEDTGHGIPVEVQERIFEPYFTTKKVSEGTGLGLAVVLGIIKDHDGCMEVESKPGEGSRFDVYFPMAKEEPRAEDIAKLPAPAGNGERILVIDDESFFLDVLREHLEDLCYRVTAHNSSRKILEIVREDPKGFDLMITDQTMPEMTGVQLVSEIRKLNPKLPVILCTGYSETVSEQSIQYFGIAKFLMKPITRQNLAWSVHEVLRDRGQT
jgi:PAS domain S-box-containing protein